MKHIVRKAYWDFEKEEKWINEMSAKGMALTDYSWCRYVFTETLNNDYTYRIELLQNLPTHAESIAYLRFLEENGVECVATYMRWIYLTKKTLEGPFHIYSDIESRIKHYKRVNVLWNTLMLIEFIAGFINLFTWITNLNHDFKPDNYLMSNLVMGCLLIMLGLFFLRLSSKIRKKIKRLLREKAIIE